MKSAILSLGVILLLASSGLAEDLAVQEAPKAFLGLIQKGQAINVVEENGGFRLVLGPTRPAPDDAEVRYARAVLDVAKNDYDSAQEANRRNPGTITQFEMRRYELRLKEASSAIDIAQKKTSGRAWKVVLVGNDYIGLQDGTEEMFIPLNSIKSLTREIKQSASNSSASR